MKPTIVAPLILALAFFTSCTKSDSPSPTRETVEEVVILTPEVPEAPSPEPEQKTEPAPPPEPTPEPDPEPALPPRPDAMKWIQSNWPGRIRKVTITQEQTIPVYADEQHVGDALLPVGDTVQVLEISKESVTISYLNHQHVVPLSATDLDVRANNALDYALAQSAQIATESSQQKTATAIAPTSTMDLIVFGNPSSEQQHDFKEEGSQTIEGGADQPARAILPLEPISWKGSSMFFTLKVDPDTQNYLTVKFWGNDTTHDRLVVFIDGKQVGYYHLGDIDVLDIGSEYAFYPDRFYYTTTPLPEQLTRGKKELEIEIRGQGGIWAYGREFERYQHEMKEASRGIYAAYTHTATFFQPQANEPQGKAPEDPSIRSKPGREILDDLEERVNGRINAIFGKKEPYTQPELRFLADCYFVKWTDAYRNEKVVEQLILGGDNYYTKYLANPDDITNDGSTRNGTWFGLGPLGEAIWLLQDELDTRDWSAVINNGKTRREAWSEMFVYARDWNMSNRRQYTNQGMIKDLYGIYLTNKGLRVFDSRNALPEAQTLGYLHEAVGIKPWLGPIDSNGRHTKPLGDNFYQLTQKGLTKELGYVGAYGEVLDWVADTYDATRPEREAPGDPAILEQLIKIQRARSYFRYPALDEEGHRAMRLEGVVGWRDFKLPGVVAYGQRGSRDASALETAVAAKDNYSVGYAQQMINDNQFFASIKTQMKSGGLHNTAGLLHIPDQYDTIRQMPQRTEELPMSPSQPDFVFSDEEVGVVAIKNGDDVFYASLYWRARHAINDLARIHHMTPEFARIATVKQKTEFKSSGMTYERQNWTDFGFARGGHRYPEKWDSAHVGEELPIARIPDGIDYKEGSENAYAGLGDFYTLHYGPYLIGMNCSEDRSFNLEIPDALRGQAVKNLVSGDSFKANGKIPVKPRTTVVLYRP